MNPKTYAEWVKLWLEIGKRLLHLPDWMQSIILEDMNTAINNRVAVMEAIQQHMKKSV